MQQTKHFQYRLWWLVSLVFILLCTVMATLVYTLFETPTVLNAKESLGSEASRHASVNLPQNSPVQHTLSIKTTANTLNVTPTPRANTTIRFAVIGDYGMDNDSEAAVAELIKSWEPDFITTVGDNNYPKGSAKTIDDNVGKYFHEFIHPYTGDYGPGATTNRFFPILGNHDWTPLRCGSNGCSGAYLDYFTLPGNERYYDFVEGPVHFFMFDSDSDEPDGTSIGSIQGVWLQDSMRASTAQWKLVFIHNPPYSSGYHGSSEDLQWPFHEWGANAVLSGDDHNYERLVSDDIPYFVNGAGGAALRDCETLLAESQLCYSEQRGAMKVEASAERISFQMFNISGEMVDSHVIEASALPEPTAIPQHKSTLHPIADTYTNVRDAEINFGEEEIMVIDGNPLKIAYLKFDLGALSGMHIASARLQMWVNDDGEANSDGPMIVKLVSDSTWSETEVTYDTQPASTDTVMGTIVNKAQGERIQIDITEYVVTHAGQLLSIAIDSEEGNNLMINSRESATLSPQLVIEYNSEAPSATATPTSTATPGQTPTVTPTATPTSTDRQIESSIYLPWIDSSSIANGN